MRKVRRNGMGEIHNTRKEKRVEEKTVAHMEKGKKKGGKKGVDEEKRCERKGMICAGRRL